MWNDLDERSVEYTYLTSSSISNKQIIITEA